LGGAPKQRSGPWTAFAPLDVNVAFMDTPEAFGPGPGDGASTLEIEMHLGLTAGAIDAHPNTKLPTFGAVIAQTFTANPGDVLSFEFNHTSVDDTYLFDHANDFSFVAIVPAMGPATFEVIADSSDLIGIPNSTDIIPAESGLKVYTSPPLLGGTYTLGIGIFNSVDNELGSALIVDNVTLTAVPEARAWLAFGMAATGVAVVSVARAHRAKKLSSK
jgi:hypothetical protein